MTNTCERTGKITYPSKTDATVQIRHMQREDGSRRRKRMTRLNPYHCQLCNCWHVGNKPREIR